MKFKKNQLKNDKKKILESTHVNLPNLDNKTEITQ
jgi:hypothetical protein